MFERVVRHVLLCGASAVLSALPASAEVAPVSVAVAEAKPPILPVEMFAEHALFSHPKISPDGRYLAVKTVVNGVTSVKVMDIDGKRAIAAISLNKDQEYGWHRWAGSGKILVSVSQMGSIDAEEFRFSRLVALEVATNQMWFVGPRNMGPEGDDLLYVAKDGSSVLLSFQQTIYEWPSVHQISLLKPKDMGREVQKPIVGTWEWYADDAGVVRMGTGWQSGKLRIKYRSGPDENLKEIASIKEGEEEKFWQVSRIVGGSDEALLIKEDADGRVVLGRYNLLTREKIETVYRNEDWDVEDAWTDDDGKPLAAFYTDDRQRVVWFDPATAKLQGQLDKALLEDEVWIGAHSDDKKRMLVFAGGEADPGGLYIYDATKRQLDPFASYRPKLDLTALVKPKPVSYSARDGLKISGYLTLPRGRAAKGLPLIILPHGGPFGIRDALDYNDEIQFLANRGYAVLQPNYRGSGGYGDAFEEKGDGQIGRAMQDDIDDAMDWAVKQGIADPARVCVVGASYGGYAAMWAVLRNPERYRCAASFAGVTDWKKILKYDAKFFSRSGARKWKERVSGGAGFDLDTVAPARAIGKLTRPLLVAHGKRDTNVPFSQYKLLLSEAQKTGVSFDQLVFEDAGHGFDTPADEARWFTTLEAFLKKHNPAD